MKVLHINTSDIEGGAARAAYRIHHSLLLAGVHSRMMVLNKKSDEWSILTTGINRKEKLRGKVRSVFDEALKIFYPKREHLPWSVNFFNNKRLVQFINESDYDLIHFHWINGDFLSIDDIKKIRRPIVWTMHDMWPFTGGCHYTGTCVKYKEECSFCEQLGKKEKTLLSSVIFSKKRKIYQEKDFVCVAPSRWMGKCAKESCLMKGKNIVHIGYSIDANVYRKLSRSFVRNLLSIEEDANVILYGAMDATSDKRKGYDLLKKAIEILHKRAQGQPIKIMVFGASEPEKKEELGFEVVYTGRMHDDLTLSLMYNCADVFVAPSREDNLPNTVVEALSCGVPCVAFAIGGMPDMIEHKRNGYLARPFDAEDLEKGIEFVLEDAVRWQELSFQAEEKAKKSFDAKTISRRYINLYEEVLRNQA